MLQKSRVDASGNQLVEGAYSLITPSDEEHQFAGIVDVARWATANAFE
jgi:hypothetical protein